MSTTIDQRTSRVAEAKKIHPFLAAEYNQLLLAKALGKKTDPKRYSEIDRQLRHVELTIDTGGLWHPEHEN